MRNEPLINTKQWTEGYIKVSENSFLHRIRAYFQKKAFFDYVADKDKIILDVGCGNGGFISLLDKMGYRNLYGVEPNEALLNYLWEGNEKLARDRIRKGFATALPFEDEYFDCIYFFNVLHHLEDTNEYTKTIQETMRCLKPGGLMIAVEPCNAFIYSAMRAVSKALAPFSELFSKIYAVISEEQETLKYFFKHHFLLRDNLLALNCKILRDKRLLHQWSFVARKPSGAVNPKSTIHPGRR